MVWHAESTRMAAIAGTEGEHKKRFQAGYAKTTSLIVGNLHEELTESELKAEFEATGEVGSVHIVCDRISGHSFGYGYVNYINPSHASLALQLHNNTTLKGKPIRVAPQYRQKEINGNDGNLFVNHLDQAVTNEKLHQIFSKFGPLVSARVATLENGTSKGYGYVRFVSSEDAQTAMQKLHKTSLNGKTVSVTQFIPRSERRLVAFVPDLDEPKRNLAATVILSITFSSLLYMFLGILWLWVLMGTRVCEGKTSSIVVKTAIGGVGISGYLLHYKFKQIYSYYLS